MIWQGIQADAPLSARPIGRWATPLGEFCQPEPHCGTVYSMLCLRTPGDVTNWSASSPRFSGVIDASLNCTRFKTKRGTTDCIQWMPQKKGTRKQNWNAGKLCEVFFFLQRAKIVLFSLHTQLIHSASCSKNLMFCSRFHVCVALEISRNSE